VKEAKITVEAREIQRLMDEISKDSGLATYGLAETRGAADAGAVETLLVTNELIRKHKADKSEVIENTMNAVENAGGKIVIVSEEHELGKQLEGLGGIGAILRYRLNI
jgi:protein pelota